MSEHWTKPCENAPVVGQYLWLALYDREAVVAGMYTGKHGTGYYTTTGEAVNPQYWMSRPHPPQHPGNPPNVREALQEAVECLESLNPIGYGRILTWKGREIIPRLKAALEHDELS